MISEQCPVQVMFRFKVCSGLFYFCLLFFQVRDMFKLLNLVKSISFWFETLILCTMMCTSSPLHAQTEVSEMCDPFRVTIEWLCKSPH